MKKENFNSDKLNDVNVLDATVTKSAKKGGKKESANEEPKRSKSDILSELRAIFELDVATYSEKLKDLCNGFLSGSINAIEFDRKRAEIKKDCTPEDITNYSDFFALPGVSSRIAEVVNLYGVKEFAEIEKVFLCGDKIKVYSKDQNEKGELIAESDLYFKLCDISASSIISGIAGAGIYLNGIRVKANKKANDKKQSLKAIDELVKRGVLSEDDAKELKTLKGLI